MRNKAKGRRKVFGAKLQGRSKITNGSALLPSIDHRSIWARRLRDLIQLHQQDLGGIEAISTAEASIVRRAATLTVELEHMELRFARRGEATAAELLLYQRVASTLRRLLEAIGLQRRPKEVDPLAAYLRRKRAAENAAAEDAELVEAEAVE